MKARVLYNILGLVFSLLTVKTVWAQGTTVNTKSNVVANTRSNTVAIIRSNTLPVTRSNAVAVARPVVFSTNSVKPSTNTSAATVPNKQTWEAMIADATRTIRTRPTSQAYLMRGVAYRQTSDFGKAIADFSESIKLNPTNDLGYSSRGTTYFMMKQWDKAIPDLSQAISLNPRVPYHYDKRGNSYFYNGNFDAALADFNEALRLKPASSGLTSKEGGVTFDVIDLRPDYPEIYNNRGIAKLAKRDVDGALKDFTSAIELTPANIGAYNNRALAKREKGDFDGAIADFSKVIQLKPGIATVYNARGFARQAKGQLADAIVDYTAAIQLSSNYVEAYYNRGRTRQLMGKPDESIADYNAVIKLNPRHINAYANRGFLFYDRMALTNAAADFRRANELGSANDRVRFRLWLIRARFGEREAATKELLAGMEKHRSRDTNDWSSNIARFLSGQSTEAQFFQATQVSDQGIATGMKCEAYFYAGTKRLIAGEKTAARDYFEKCLATDQKSFVDYKSAAAELKSLKPK